MKKLLVVLLALTVVGVFAFADDAAAPAAPKPIGTYGSWNTGSAVLYSQSGSNTAQTGWNNGWDTANPGIDQEWNFGYAGNDYGYSATLEFGNDGTSAATTTSNNSAISLSWFKTYYNLNKYVQIAIGKPRDGTYRSQGSLVEGFAGNFFEHQKYSVEATVFPIDGLQATALLGVPAAWTNTAYADEFALAAQYTLPNVVTVNGFYQGKDINNGSVSYTSFSASTTAIKNLTVIAGANLPGDGNNDVIYGSVGYVAGPVTAQADVAYKTTVNSFGTEENVFYTQGKWNFGARFGYDDGKGVGAYGNNLSDIQDDGGVLVYPYIQANFDNGSFVQIGVAYESGAGPTNPASLIQVPLFYLWAF